MYQAAPVLTPPPPVVSGYMGPPRPVTNLRDSIGLANILKMIEGQVGTPIPGPLPEYLRYAKAQHPPKYDGQDDEMEFNVWLSKVLSFCRRLHMCGPDLDAARLDVLQESLSEEAAGWFHSTVESTYRTQAYWTFTDAVTALYKRFILTDSFQQASYNFRKVQYSTKGGVGRLYQEMCHWAQRMIDKPSESVFRDKFLASLPLDIEQNIVVYQRIDPMSVTSRELYMIALGVEDATKNMKLRRAMYSNVPAQNPQLHQGLNKTQSMVAPNTRNTAHKPTRRLFLRPIRKDQAPVSTSQSTSGPTIIRKTPFKKDTSVTRPSTFVPRTTPTTTRSQPVASSRPPQTKPAVGSRNGGPCYSCGQLGHYASECPKGNRMHVQHLVDIPQEQPTPEQPSEGFDNTEGETDPHFEDEPPQSEFEEQLQNAELEFEAETEDMNDDEVWGYELYSATMHLEEDKSKIEQETQKEEELQFAAARMLQAFQMRAEPPIKSIRTAWLYDSRIRKLAEPSDQPVRNRVLQRPLCAEVLVNGVPAYALFDTGCTTDSISPALAFVTQADRIDLEVQMGLQLGAKGSRTKINHGAKARIEIGPVRESYYFDVVDIDRYDLILGTPFFTKHDVALDFRNRTIKIDGVEVPTYNKIDEALLLKTRKEDQQLALGKQLQAAIAARAERQ